MVRAAIRRPSELTADWPEATEGSADEAERLAAYLREVANDELAREAVAISSSSLASSLDKVAAGGMPVLRDARRMAAAVTRYLLRMTTRATPFGLLAGVAAGGFDEAPIARWGQAHHKAVRPDMEWLGAWVTRTERRSDVLPTLHVVANNLCFVRGDRLVLPYAPMAEGSQDQNRSIAEISVRHSGPVRLVMNMARHPIEYTRLQQVLREHYPHAPDAEVENMLRQLVQQDLLLTDLRPPPEIDDPLGYVLDRLTTIPSLPHMPDLAAHVDQLQQVRDELLAYAAQPPGAGLDLLRSLTTRMRRLHVSDRLVQVDLALDAQVLLPRLVASEAAHAADVLCRLADPRCLPLRQYHFDFLERYGVGQLVPVTELVDPDIGLGAPAGYQVPPSTRVPRPAHGAAIEERDRILGALTQEATLQGQREILLDEVAVDRLAIQDGDGIPAPPTVELCAHLLAASLPAIQAGAFRLVVTTALGSTTAGAMMGRFTCLLGEHDCDRLATLARSIPTSAPHALRAQLSFGAFHARGVNVVQVPQWLDHAIPLGCFADPVDTQVLALDDLAVSATWDRLYLVARSLGREVVPTAFHVLNFRAYAPNLARLLREITHNGVRGWQPWAWGAAEALAYLPRVRYGRTVLASARWRLDESELRDRTRTAEQWRDRFENWRNRWQVPDAVRVAAGDNYLELDLTNDAHLQVLRDEMARRAELTLTEVPAGGEYGNGWLGGRVNEIVFPLLASHGHKAMQTTLQPGPVNAPVHRGVEEHLPGGPWLYGKVYCSLARHDEVLAAYLPHLVAAASGIDRWFFVRYRDPEPHLRLRFHGALPVVRALLAALHDWVSDLRRDGLANRLQLDTYTPETGRYGGPHALAAAERVFHADSQAALTQLALLRSGQLDVDALILAAANHVDIANRLTGAEAATCWLTDLVKTNHHTAFQQQRAAALRIIDPHTDWSALRATPAGRTVIQAWADRGTALVNYREQIHTADAPRSLQDVLASLLHMHHNRLIGLDLDAEARSYAIARGVARTYRMRQRMPDR